MFDIEKLFWRFFNSHTEDEVEDILKDYGLIESAENWKPYGNNENNYAIVENQQAAAVPALIEKLTNGIDAILEKRCLEEDIDPKSSTAPQSVEEAVAQFFPNHKNWDLATGRKDQAEMLQVIAQGPKRNTSLVVYDDGIGQLPENFEKTFLSLVRGNKNEIHFVQGKYNMGGAGAVVFCGKQRYQLIASKHFQGDAKFGFTIVRRHPLSKTEKTTKKNTWYEYLCIDGLIPSFSAKEMDLGLYNRKFKTGTILKLYSYQLPTGVNDISRDLNQSINEYLFSPALPIYTIEQENRYPNNVNRQRHLYGLKRRLENDNGKYIEHFFSEESVEKDFGKVKVTCYVFKARADGKNSRKTKETISREFFKNNMSVLFSLSGQVHGHFTSEFITRTLKLPLLKNHLLIHVDCSGVNTEVRNELFMASRDRLKDGEESKLLRAKVAEILKDSKLKEINASRKASLNVEGGEAEEMLRNITRNLPIQDDLAKLLNQTFKLEDDRSGTKQQKEKKKKEKDKNGGEKTVFNPQRFPTTFRLKGKHKEEKGLPLIKIPKDGNRRILFETDVEDQYFDRVQEPGELQIALLGPKHEGGTEPNDNPQPDAISDVLDVVQSSPSHGEIRVHLKSSTEIDVGDTLKIRASLSSPEGDLDQIFMVKISDPEKKKKVDKPGDQPDDRLGLPEPIMIYREKKEDMNGLALTWDEMDERGHTIDHNTVVKPIEDGEGLSQIFINMDSSALLNFRKSAKSVESIEVADKRYFSAVYFHTLFLYAITKNRKYELKKNGQEDHVSEDIEITEYLSDLFSASYAQFLLSFDTQELVNALDS